MLLDVFFFFLLPTATLLLLPDSVHLFGGRSAAGEEQDVVLRYLPQHDSFDVVTTMPYKARGEDLTE